MTTTQEEQQWADRLVAYCVAMETAPRPAVKPRALIVIREDGTIVVRRRGRDGAWTAERFATLAEASRRQADLIRGFRGA